MPQKKLQIVISLTVNSLSREDCEDLGIDRSEYDGAAAVENIDMDDLLEWLQNKMEERFINDDFDKHINFDGIRDLKVKGIKLSWAKSK